MDRINWPFALAYGSLGIFVVAFWVYAVPEILGFFSERPADCFALTSHECAALMESR